MPKKNTNRRTVDGFLILDKPHGLSSNHALQRVKRLFNAAKAGHTGNLDPLATGVLPICFGEATKFSQHLLDADKHYNTTAKLGIQTTTGDAEGEIIQEHCVTITESDIREILPQFFGDIQQIPPMFSALKHHGTPLYKLALEGQTVERKTRTITIKELAITHCSIPEVSLKVHCTKGTYIRTLVEDIGHQLGCGAYVKKLRRAQSGPYSEKQSYTIDQLQKIYDENGFIALDDLLLPVDSALCDWPSIHVDELSCQRLRQGQSAFHPDINIPKNNNLRIYFEDTFIGIGVLQTDSKIIPKRLIRQI